VVRYENDGWISLIADKYNGKRLNSPNDVVPHPDGSYWFTDPPYGGQLYEGAPDAAGGGSNPKGRLKPRLGQALEIGDSKREPPTGTYRGDSHGQGGLGVGEGQVPEPNGLGFSAGDKKLYILSTGKGTGDTRAGWQGRHVGVRHRQRQQGHQRQALQQLHDRRRQVRAGRRALRRRGQPLGFEQCGKERRLQWRHGVESGRQADRSDPAPGDLR